MLRHQTADIQDIQLDREQKQLLRNHKDQEQAQLIYQGYYS